MIYDFIRELRLLESEELLEDKMIKYGGELSPRFGWCAIFVGGPGSGKGTAVSFLSRLEGDYYNVDNLKEIERMWKITDPKTGKPHSDNFTTPSHKVPKTDKKGRPLYDKKTGEPIYYDEYRNMKNSEFVSELHLEMKPLSKKWKASILNNPENERGRKRLPNIIFDITGDETSKLMEIINSLKPIGYKIAVIWVLPTIKKAQRNNLRRDRVVNFEDILVPKHRDVIMTIEDIFSSGKIEKIDDFWVVDSAIKENPKDNPVEYYKAQNVYNIPSTKDGLKTFRNIMSRIIYNKQEIKRIEKERDIKFT